MAPPGERPPLVVTSHGGPTSGAFSGLQLTVQVLTSRGLAVLDVMLGDKPVLSPLDRFYQRLLAMDTEEVTGLFSFLAQAIIGT